jgi:hypothetical protein
VGGNRLLSSFNRLLAELIGVDHSLFCEGNDALGNEFVSDVGPTSNLRAAHAISNATPMTRLVSGSNLKPSKNSVMGMACLHSTRRRGEAHAALGHRH